MSVYVDALADRGWELGPSAHLFADTEEELYAFAARLGCRRAWFQRSRRGVPHFDLTARRRERAVALGAVELDRRGVVELIRRLRSCS